MARLIDAERLEKWMKREEWGTPDERWRPESEFGKIIDAQPTVEPNRRMKLKPIRNNGYEVINAYEVKAGKGYIANKEHRLYIVIAHNPLKSCPQPWVCWYMEDDGFKYSFFWGKYSEDDIFPKKQFIERIIAEEHFIRKDNIWGTEEEGEKIGN